MEGIVSCIRHTGNGLYYLAGAEGQRIYVKEIKSHLILNLRDIIEFDEGTGSLSELGKSPEAYLKGLDERIDASIKSRIAKEPYHTSIDELDKTTERMWRRLTAAASLLLRKIMLGTPILIRFHNDADGSSGATGLYRALIGLAASSGIKCNLLWTMHKGVAYTKEDAESDVLLVNSYDSIEKPLLVIIDFGTSDNSNPGLDAALKKFEIIWLDHHPLDERFLGTGLEHYINPWLFGSDSSYTAGVLACVFARTFSKIDTEELEAASLIGDYSRSSPKREGGRQAATILDLITSDVRIASKRSDNLTPVEIEEILGDPKRRKELFDYANIKLGEVMDSALSSLRLNKTPRANVYVLNYGELREDDSKYPLPGRFSSKLLEKLEELNAKPCVAVLHYGAYISIRISDAISGEVGVLEAIKELREMYRGQIDSGGGHRNAASIKLVDQSSTKVILRHLVEMIKIRLQ